MSDPKGNKQGFNAEIFKKAVRLSAGIDNQFIPVQVFDAIVQSGSQNEEEMTCVVDSVDNTVNNLTVRYNLCISDGEINVPDDESTVTIIKTAFTDPYIAKSTDLKSKTISVGTQQWSNDGIIQSFDFYEESGVPSGSFGGFLKLVDPISPTGGTLAKIQQLENKLNDFINKWDTFCSSYIPGSPATTGLPATLASSTVTPIAPLTKREDLENKNIIHGTKNLTL